MKFIIPGEPVEEWKPVKGYENLYLVSDTGKVKSLDTTQFRSNGKAMLNFKPGAKMIANKYNLKVQPIILFNTRNIVDSKKLRATPGVVKVIFLDSIQADKNTDWFEETEKNMKMVFDKECKNYAS